MPRWGGYGYGGKFTEVATNAVNRGVPIGTRLLRGAPKVIDKISTSPLAWGIGIATVGASAVNHYTNSQVALLRYVNQAAISLREKELGGQLEAGYLTTAAATDRQRLVQSMMDSNFNGRRFIGNEARFYRNTF